MLATALSASIVGVDGVPVRVEVDVAFGLPGLTIVGLAGSAVLEARERVRAALRNSGFEVPSRRITINLAPADRTVPRAPGTTGRATHTGPRREAGIPRVPSAGATGLIRPSGPRQPMRLLASSTGAFSRGRSITPSITRFSTTAHR